MSVLERSGDAQVAIFGAGRIGKIHAGNLVRQPGVTLKHVVDPDAAAAKALAAQHGAEVGTVEGVFADPAIRAVVIASSTDTHADLIERAARSGKAIFCEKPVDLDYERAKRCLETVRKAGVPCLIGFQRRYDPTFAAAIIVVFLLLAAMYESWRLPWAVLLGSPLVALGAFFGVWLAGYDNNVYVQIGNIMLIGLAAKNAILIVEFAKAKHEQDGMSLEEAALESARLRFRPILMTAFAFILGVIPLMKASGAGAGAQNVMGTAVFWGMLVATALGVFVIPGNFAFVEQLGRRHKRAKGAAPSPAPEPGPALREEHP